MKDYLDKLSQMIKIALEEDCALEDATSDAVIDENYEIDFEINSRQDAFLSGIDSVRICFEILKFSEKFRSKNLSYDILKKDGAKISKEEAIVRGRGNAKLIFAAERVILNSIQHMSGISTLTNKFLETLSDERIKILDTRKTTIGLRKIEKYAVSCGGAINHRNDLSDAILIKDNHIAANSDIYKTVEKAINNNRKDLEIIVECDNVAQVKLLSSLSVDRIMLDNMSITQIKDSIALIDKKSKIEVSGGVNLGNIRDYRGLDIDYISIGAITHSAIFIDFGLDIL